MDQDHSADTQQEIQPEIHENDRKQSGDPEVGETKDAAPQRTDPFGDEENAEVKYRTMSWW